MPHWKPLPRNSITLAQNSSQSATFHSHNQTWTQPADIFSVLLILGGDVVNRALAQLVGSRVTPVAFSFGWVSYSVSSLLLASVSNAAIMPAGSDCSCLIVTAKNGYVRSNSSWVISRVLRDFEYWMDTAVGTKLNKILHDRHEYMKRHTKPGTVVPKPTKTGLCISVYEPCLSKRAGSARHDMLYWSGFAIALIQLSIATVPFVTEGDWGVIAITLFGVVLAFLTGALPQWRHEKWFCRRNSTNDYLITRGNGAQHVLLILGNGHGLNLEDLAVGIENLDTIAGWTTRYCLFVLGCLWIALLVAAASLSQPSWYLLGVGGIGMLQNLLVAGWRRKPGALGVHLNFCKVIGHMSTMDALLQLESEYSNAGRSLLPIFFPGLLLPDEDAQWEVLRVRDEQEKAIKQQKVISGQALPDPTALTSWILQAKTSEGK